MSALSHDHIFGAVTTAQFKELILPLRDRLFRFALSYVKNEDEAKDVVQEVMIKSWEEIDKPNTIRNIEAWCVTLCKNKSLDKLKKKGRHYMQIVERDDLHADTRDPYQITQEREMGQKIRAIISDLPGNQKDVINLRDVEGYTYQEIAETLGLELNNVKVLLHRARGTVRQQINKMNDHGITKAQ